MNKDTLFTVHRPVDPSVVKQPDTGRSKSSKDYWKNDLKVTIKEIMLVLAHIPHRQIQSNFSWNVKKTTTTFYCTKEQKEGKCERSFQFQQNSKDYFTAVSTDLNKF